MSYLEGSRSCPARIGVPLLPISVAIPISLYRRSFWPLWASLCLGLLYCRTVVLEAPPIRRMTRLRCSLVLVCSSACAATPPSCRQEVSSAQLASLEYIDAFSEFRSITESVAVPPSMAIEFSMVIGEVELTLAGLDLHNLENIDDKNHLLEIRQLLRLVQLQLESVREAVNSDIETRIYFIEKGFARIGRAWDENASRVEDSYERCAERYREQGFDMVGQYAPLAILVMVILAIAMAIQSANN